MPVSAVHHGACGEQLQYLGQGACRDYWEGKGAWLLLFHVCWSESPVCVVLPRVLSQGGGGGALERERGRSRTFPFARTYTVHFFRRIDVFVRGTVY